MNSEYVIIDRFSIKGIFSADRICKSSSYDNKILIKWCRKKIAKTKPRKYISLVKSPYSKTCVKRPLSKRQKLIFKINYRLMQVKRIAGKLLQELDQELVTDVKKTVTYFTGISCADPQSFFRGGPTFTTFFFISVPLWISA